MGRGRDSRGMWGMAGHKRRGYELGGACGEKKDWAGPALGGPMEWDLSVRGGD